MPWRKWLVRSLVFTIVGACASVALVYQRWTNPAAVREQVIGKLQMLYPGAVVTVDSARLRILGGISVSELRLTRRDDADKNEFVHVPSAILYHDKEKMLDGQMVLRKVELYRPRLRVVRERDGSWNLRGILGPSQPKVPLPTLIIHHGTIVLEDRQEGSNPYPVEICDVNMSFINDPLPTVIVSGSANSETVGRVQVKGTYQRGNKDLVLNVKARELPLRTALLRRLNIQCPNNILADLNLEAQADLEANVAYRPDQKEPLEYRLNVRITKGKLEHPRVPLPLSDLRATLECSNGLVRIRDLHACSGTALLSGEGSALLPCIDQFFDASLEIKHLNVDNDLAARLPDKIRNLRQIFQATGPATLRLTCARRGGKWTNHPSGESSRLIVQPEDFSISFVKFPYPLEKLTGRIEWDMQRQRTVVDVTGYAHQRPVVIRGAWQGQALETESTFDIHTTDMPVCDKLIAALTPKLRKLTESFHPRGKVDVKSFLRRTPGSTDFYSEYHIALHEGAICWDEFPYPLEKVTGLLDVYPKHWEFRDGRGSFQGGEISLRGKSLRRPDDTTGAEDGLSLEITGRNLGMDRHLHKALGPMPALAKAWNNFQPQGRLNFSAAIERFPDQAQDLDVLVDVNGCSLEPVFLPYLLHDLSGQFRFRKNRLDIARVRAKHRQVQLEMDEGTVDLRPGGGHYTDLRELRVRQLAMDPEFVRALPKSLQTILTSLDVKQPLDLKTRLVVAQASEPGSAPEVWWDGQVHLNGAQLNTGVTWDKVTGTLASTGKHNGRQLQGLTGNLLLEQASLYNQPFKKVHGKFHVKDDAPEIFNLALHAPIFGGDITGQVRLECTSAMRYELNLTASQVNLKDFGLHNLGPSSQLNGVAAARLQLSGMGARVDTLDGNGSIDVPNGRLYNLPLLLDLLKFLGLRWPDRTAFEELHALFGIQGSRVTVRRLDLLGNAISLSGKGDFNLDGTHLSLDFYPTWAHVEQMLPAAVRPLPSTISKSLLTIEVRGKVGGKAKDLKFTKKLVPLVTDPLLFVRDRMVGPPQIGNVDKR